MTTKIDIISGVLGAGKTTLINRILKDVSKTETVAIIENEFGEIGVDGDRFAESGVAVREISGGCICCTLFGDFVSATQKLISQIRPVRIIVEPTGVGKLTDVLKALEAVNKVEPIDINMVITIVDPIRHTLYSKMFGDFFKDQIQMAKTIFLSRTQLVEKESADDVVQDVVKHLKSQNPNADIVTRPWDELTGAEITAMGEEKKGFVYDVAFDSFEKDFHAPDHHHDSENIEDDDIEVWSIHTSTQYSRKRFQEIFNALENRTEYGTVVRGKGIFQTPERNWLQYDYVTGESSFRQFHNTANLEQGKLVFIGKQLNQSALKKLLN